MAKNLIRSFTAESIRELAQAAGFRAEIEPASAGTGPVIRSASSGLAFEIRLLNPLQIDAKNYADLTFTAGLQLQGPLALDIVNRWNASKRFSRLYITRGFLILAMDVVLQGGVPPEHLRAQIEIWDRLLQELLAYLRNAAKETAAQKMADSTPREEATAPDIENKDEREPVPANSTDMSTDVPGAAPIDEPEDAQA
jgi:hypothetical protein